MGGHSDSNMSVLLGVMCCMAKAEDIHVSFDPAAPSVTKIPRQMERTDLEWSVHYPRKVKRRDNSWKDKSKGYILEDSSHPCVTSHHNASEACAQRAAKELAEQMGFETDYPWPVISGLKGKIRFKPVRNHKHPDTTLHCEKIREWWSKDRVFKLIGSESTVTLPAQDREMDDDEVLSSNTLQAIQTYSDTEDCHENVDRQSGSSDGVHISKRTLRRLKRRKKRGGGVSASETDTSVSAVENSSGSLLANPGSASETTETKTNVPIVHEFKLQNKVSQWRRGDRDGPRYDDADVSDTDKATDSDSSPEEPMGFVPSKGKVSSDSEDGTVGSSEFESCDSETTAVSEELPDPCPSEWLMDTGSGLHLIPKVLATAFKEHIRKRKKIKLSTANGPMIVNEELPIHVSSLDEKTKAVILPDTPAVLSVGLLCVESGYRFEWPAYSKEPFMVTPEGYKLVFYVKGHVPYLDATSDAFPVRRHRGKGPPTEDDSERGPPPDLSGGVDNFIPPVPPPVGGRRDLKAMAESVQHLMTHWPKNPYCKTCQLAKLLRIQHRRGAMKRSDRRRPTRFGDLSMLDHLISRKDNAIGLGNKKNCVMFYDEKTNWNQAVPVSTKSGTDTYNAIGYIAGDEKIRLIYSDGSKEIKRACKKHKIPHEVAGPGIPQTRGKIESIARVDIDGTRCNLENSGLPPLFWPFGIVHFTFSKNVQVINGESAYNARLKNGHFNGILIPFGAYIEFRPLPHHEDGALAAMMRTSDSRIKKAKRPKWSARGVPGVMMGYVTAPGGRWSRRYLVADLREFVGMDLRVGGPVTTQEVYEVIFDALDIRFPLKNMYDIATKSLEGLSAPKIKVAPDRIEDLNIPNKVEPVGAPVSDGEEADTEEAEERDPQLPPERENGYGEDIGDGDFDGNIGDAWFNFNPLLRLHRRLRTRLFSPEGVVNCPDLSTLHPHRTTFIQYDSGARETITDSWQHPRMKFLELSNLWIGTTKFYHKDNPEPFNLIDAIGDFENDNSLTDDLGDTEKEETDKEADKPAEAEQADEDCPTGTSTPIPVPDTEHDGAYVPEGFGPLLPPHVIRGEGGYYVRGRFVKDHANTGRPPDADPDVYATFGKKNQLRQRMAWRVFGDSLAEPPPEGWPEWAWELERDYEERKKSRKRASSSSALVSSCDTTDISSDNNDVPTAGLGTWTREDYGATHYQTTVSPVSGPSCGPIGGPPWDKVIRRVTYEKNGRVLQDLWAEQLFGDALSGKFVSGNRVKDIRTEFWYKPEEWSPSPECLRARFPAKKSVIVSPAASIPEIPCESNINKPEQYDTDDIPILPCIKEPYVSSHRERNAPWPMFNAAVARPVDRKERNANEAAQAAINKEWTRLRTIKYDGGQGCWDESKVEEWRDVAKRAIKEKITIHVGRIFDICVEKGSELQTWLPDKDGNLTIRNPDKKYKGRAVFQGNNVRDENFDVALFNDLSSAPATMDAAKLTDMWGLQEGYVTEQADAEQAYTQSKLGGTPTWVRLPKDQWPQAWIDKNYKDPVCPLVLSLYGHPDAGGYWERHCEKHLLSVGWKPVPDWRSCYFHADTNSLLVVYVDDFKLSAPADKIEELWNDIRGPPTKDEGITSGVVLARTEPSGKFLGCGHIIKDVISPLSGKTVRSIEWDMSDFFASCVDHYCQLTGKPKTALPKVQTPFLDEDLLRKKHGICPGGFQLTEYAKQVAGKSKAKKKKAPTLEVDTSNKENVPKDMPISGVLKPVASSILMKLLYGARFVRHDLLRAISYLARHVTKWLPMHDEMTHRLICYVNSTSNYRQFGWLGNKLSELRLHLYADADLASDPIDSVSTSGVFLEFQGTDTRFPISSQSKKQTAVSHSTPEAEIVAADHALRTIGLPVLSFWNFMVPDGTNQIMFHEDNSACIRVLDTGRNPTMRHMGRTHRIDLAWLHERLRSDDIAMVYTESKDMAADIFTKAFPDNKASVWQSDQLLICIGDTEEFWKNYGKVKPATSTKNATGGADSSHENSTTTPVKHKSKKQTEVSHSTAENELVAFAAKAKVDDPITGGPDRVSILKVTGSRNDIKMLKRYVSNLIRYKRLFLDNDMELADCESDYERTSAIEGDDSDGDTLFPRSTVYLFDDDSEWHDKCPLGIGDIHMVVMNESGFPFDNANCFPSVIETDPYVDILDDMNLYEDLLGERVHCAMASVNRETNTYGKDDICEFDIRVKRLTKTARLPTKGTKESAGFDISADCEIVIPPHGRVLVKTGLAMVAPRGTYLRMAPRSGLSLKHMLHVGAGVIDRDYCGECGVVMFNHGENEYKVRLGDKIAQVIPELISDARCVEVSDVNDTERGNGGFGSTGMAASSSNSPPSGNVGPIEHNDNNTPDGRVGSTPSRPEAMAMPDMSNVNDYDSVLIEFCAYPDSILSRPSWYNVKTKCIRVTMENDLTTIAGVSWLMDVIKSVPSDKMVHLWTAIPCTGGTSWVRVNRVLHENYHEREKQLKEEFHAIWKSFIPVTRLVLKNKGHVSIEWPKTCSYWVEDCVINFMNSARFNYKDTVFDGCMYDLRVESGRHEGMLLKKAWRVASTIWAFRDCLNLRCSNDGSSTDHEHARVSGSSTVLTGRYTPMMARCIHDAHNRAVSIFLARLYDNPR